MTNDPKNPQRPDPQPTPPDRLVLRFAMTCDDRHDGVAEGSGVAYNKAAEQNTDLQNAINRFNAALRVGQRQPGLVVSTEVQSGGVCAFNEYEPEIPSVVSALRQDYTGMTEVAITTDLSYGRATITGGTGGVIGNDISVTPQAIDRMITALNNAAGVAEAIKRDVGPIENLTPGAQRDLVPLLQKHAENALLGELESIRRPQRKPEVVSNSIF